MRAFQTPEEPLLTVDEAQRLALEEVVPLGAETVSLGEAGGRVLAADVVASDDVPAADNSAMDGYAVIAADVPGTLRVVADIAAGSSEGLTIERGTAARIMTGAPVPRGADAVIQVEKTDGGTDFVTIDRALEPGANIRRRGEDMRAGQVVVRAGVVLRAGELAAIATAGATSVTVGRRPVVAILATGSELTETPAPGKIVNSNAHAIVDLVREAGAVPKYLGIVPDDLDATVRAIESAAGCDFIVSSGGVSVGAYDFVKEALEALGAETRFWRVAMKPGKPVVMARLGEQIYFGLPGNPVSSMVSFTLFVAPALRKAAGQTSQLLPPVVNVRMAAPVKGTGDRRTYLRVRVSAVDGELVATPMRAQGSGMTTSMVEANGLAIIDIGTKRIDAGETAPVMITGPLFTD